MFTNGEEKRLNSTVNIGWQQSSLVHRASFSPYIMKNTGFGERRDKRDHKRKSRGLRDREMNINIKPNFVTHLLCSLVTFDSLDP